MLVCLSVMYYTGIMINNAYMVEEIKTLACAEYYYPTTARNVTLPMGGDPMRLCAVPFVDKRTSEIMAYTDTLSSFTGFISSLLIANFVLPKVSRRTAALVAVALSVLSLVALCLVPTHYSLDPMEASVSTMHPQASQHLFEAIIVISNLLGATQTMFPIVMQVMVVDVCKDGEKASSFAKLMVGNLLGATASSICILVLFPFFGLHFSVLYHTGPCSPFLVAAAVMALTFILVAMFLPETKPSSVAVHAENEDTASPTYVDTCPTRDQITDDDDNAANVTWLKPVIDTVGLFSYVLPYKSSPDAKWDYKLSVMLIALLFGDTLMLAWSNLVVFASSHLDFGPEDVAVLLGALGASKGLFNLFGLPLVVKHIRKVVRRRIRNEMAEGEVSNVDRRERYIVETDKIVAMLSLGVDVVGWMCMGLAAKHLSVAGIGGGLGVLLFATGALPSIQALAVDLFQAQNRPSRDPIAARDAFITLFAVFQNVTSTVGPFVNNAIYTWSIDHNMSFLLFFSTSSASLVSLLLVASVGSVFK